jgi:hypothetical protein
MAPPPIGYTADQRSRAARGATAPIASALVVEIRCACEVAIGPTG